MRMDAGLDTGPIVAQRRVRLTGDETAPELEARLAAWPRTCWSSPRAVAGRLACAACRSPTDGATLTRPLRREDGRLDPTRGRSELERQVRAYQPWPGTFLEPPTADHRLGGAGRRPSAGRGTARRRRVASRLTAIGWLSSTRMACWSCSRSSRPVAGG